MKNVKHLSIPFCMLTLMAASCSHDDNTPAAPSGAEIRFTVVAPPAPRIVSKPETTTATINKFLLNAFTNGKPYITNLNVNKQENNWKPEATIYWPATPVNFYAVSPDIRPVGGEPSNTDSDSYTFSYTNDGAVDLLYSVAAEQTQSAASTPQPVTLNFRHALSRVVVMMRSSNSDIKVNVSKVTLMNIYENGKFTFPKKTTSPDLTVKGTWKGQTALGNPVLFDGTAKLLTADAQEFSSSDYKFTLPQDLTPLEQTGTTFSGSYIEVKGTITDTNGVALWPNIATPAENKDTDGMGVIRFPLSSADAPANWQGGMAYIYNIVIDKVPGLSGIDFTVTVDEIDYDNQIQLPKE